MTYNSANTGAEVDDVISAFKGATTGMVAKTGTGAGAFRTIAGTTDEITVTNGNGVSGNPTLALAAAVTASLTLANTAQQPPSEGAFANGDKTKLDGIEAGADITDAGNVAAAGAIMDGDFSTNGLMKRTGAGTYATAVADTDYQDVLAEGAFADGDKTKLDFITITQGVDLDAIETRVNNLDAAVILMGTWDASLGAFPGGGTAQAGESWIVSTGGTIDGVVFTADDRIIAITDNASTTVYASNWHKADYTDLVQSVAGLTGAISAGGLRTAINVEDGADVTDETNVVAALNGATLADIGTPASTDRVLIRDASDSFNLKYAAFSEFGGGGGTPGGSANDFQFNDGGAFGGSILKQLSTKEIELQLATLTGSDAQTGLNITQTWNTTGQPTLIKGTVTDTASGAQSDFFEFYQGANRRAFLTKGGQLEVTGRFRIIPGSGTVVAQWTGLHVGGGYLSLSSNTVLNGAGGEARLYRATGQNHIWAMYNNGNTNGGGWSAPDGGELTIATGAITVTGSYHTVDTESDAASDDLDTINGHTDGMHLVLQAENGARTVVVKNGTGNIQLGNTGADISLDNEFKSVHLVYSGALSAWVEV